VGVGPQGGSRCCTFGSRRSLGGMPFPVKLRLAISCEIFAIQTLPASCMSLSSAPDAKFHIGAVPLSSAPALCRDLHNSILSGR
jgi:hypothetical protein